MDDVWLQRDLGQIPGFVGRDGPLPQNGTVMPRAATALGAPNRYPDLPRSELLTPRGEDLDPAGTVRPTEPAQLSGGQQQRVGVATALAADPADHGYGRAVARWIRSCGPSCRRRSCGSSRTSESDRLRDP